MTTWRTAIVTGVALLIPAVGAEAQTAATGTTGTDRTVAGKVTKAQITGEVVHVEGNQLVARMPNDELRLFTVPPGQQFMIDGQPKQLSDVKPGTTLTATTATLTQTVTDRTTTIKNGTVALVRGNHLIVRDENGETQAFTVPADFKFTVDGNEEATVRDLRRGMRISATKIVSDPRTTIESATIVTGKTPK